MTEIVKIVDYEKRITEYEAKISNILKSERPSLCPKHFGAHYSQKGLVIASNTKAIVSEAENNHLWVADNVKASSNKALLVARLTSPLAATSAISFSFLIWLLVNFGADHPGDPYYNLTTVAGIFLLLVSIFSAVLVFCNFEDGIKWDNWRFHEKPNLVAPDDSLHISGKANKVLLSLMKTHDNDGALTSLVKAKIDVCSNGAEFSTWVIIIGEIMEIMPTFPLTSILMNNVSLFEILDNLRNRKKEIEREEAVAIQCGKETLKQLTLEAEESAKDATLAFINDLSPEMLIQRKK